MNKNDKAKINKKFKTNSHHNNKNKQEKQYLITGPDIKADTLACAEPTETMHNEYNDVYTGIGCFKCTFLCRSKNTKPYQVPHRHTVYALQKPSKKSWKTTRTL